MDEILRNLSPVIVGMFAAAAGLLYARRIRWEARRDREARARRKPHAAE